MIPECSNPFCCGGNLPHTRILQLQCGQGSAEEGQSPVFPPAAGLELLLVVQEGG